MPKPKGFALELMHSEIHARQPTQAETIQSSERMVEEKNLL